MPLLKIIAGLFDGSTAKFSEDDVVEMMRRGMVRFSIKMPGKVGSSTEVGWYVERGEA